MKFKYQRDYTERIRVGLIGVGHHSYRTLLPTLHFLPVDLRAIVANRDEERCARTASEFGCRYYMDVDEMYEGEDLDAVLVCVSPRLHPDLTIGALSRGLHVWLEKPPAMRAADVRRMIDARGDRVTVVGLKKAFMPVADKAREIATEFGNLQSILGVYPMSLPTEGAAILESPSVVSNWLANGVHPLSFMMSIGGAVSGVTAVVNQAGHGSCTLEFANGCMGTLHLASGPLPMESYYLYGDSWHCDITNNNRLALYRDYGPHDTETFIPHGFDTGAIVWEAQNCLITIENSNLFTQGLYAELKHFCDCVLEDRRPTLGTLEFAHELMQVYEAALHSGGHRVALS